MFTFCVLSQAMQRELVEAGPFVVALDAQYDLFHYQSGVSHAYIA